MKNNILKSRYTVIGMIFLILIFIFLIACNCSNDKTGTNILSNNVDARWIGDRKPLPENDSLLYLDDPAPIFRKEFSMKSEVKSARLLITAAGYYKATFNGSRLGKNMLDPAWTDYNKRIYYAEYDITNLIESKNNCIGVTLGNGFYNPLPLKMWGRRNMREVLNTGRPVFIGKIIVEYKNGKKDVIITDESWRFSYGPIIKNNIYLGEVFDSRKEIDDWDKPGFDDTSWVNAIPVEGPHGKLQKVFFPPIQITKKISPLNIYSPERGIFIADMGVNFTGLYRIKLKGQPGDTVTFRFGERIYQDGSLNPMTTVCGQIKKAGVGGSGAPDIAWQTDSYIFSDNTETWYQPEFTFHIYRYMEISGLAEKPEIDDIEGLSIHSNVPDKNSFSSSSDLINSIQEATERTFLANLIGVQSDCPAREKFGYGGDLNATSESFIYNFDMNSFYRKTVYDWVDAINDSIFVDTAPYVGIEYCGLSWESAFITTQYYLYLYYNDTALVKEMYDLNNKWMDKAAMIHPEGIVDKGLGDHESLEPVPVQLTGSTHYLLCARIMKEFALLMGDEKNESKYGFLAEKLEDLIRKEFWEKPVEGRINRQTLFASLLYYNIIPPDETATAVDSLLNAVKKAPFGHFTTGIFGTKYILEAISHYISPGEVFDIINSTAYPGWGFMIENGATTIWETWKESDNTYSNCHPMFGTVSEWFYRWLGGIKPDPKHPGFIQFYLTPFVPEGLDHADCTYYSPYGKIVSNWKKENKDCVYQIKIPSGTFANVSLQMESSQNIKIEKSQDAGFKHEQVKGLNTGNFQLGEGKYTITIN